MISRLTDHSTIGVLRNNNKLGFKNSIHILDPCPILVVALGDEYTPKYDTCLGTYDSRLNPIT